MATLSSLFSSLLVVGAVGLGGYGLYKATFAPGGMFRGAEVSGELAVAGSKEGSWTTPLARCQSGEHSGFFGVDLGTDETIAIRVTRDPVKGMHVLLRAPKSGKAAALTAENCPGLVADVRRTNTTYNDIRVLDGDITFDCELPGGGHAKLAAHFEGCR
jgi:hypothetical protein